jgi:hypothetical protein
MSETITCTRCEARMAAEDAEQIILGWTVDHVAVYERVCQDCHLKEYPQDVYWEKLGDD